MFVAVGVADVFVAVVHVFLRCHTYNAVERDTQGFLG